MLGVALKAARRKRGMTQRQVAEATHVDLDALRGLEQGRYAHPSFFTVAAIVVTLNLSLSKILKEHT